MLTLVTSLVTNGFMKLKSWITDQNITVAKFAEMIGVNRVSVSRYCSGERIPEPPVMDRIKELTKEQVTANDFYNKDTAA